MSARATAGDVLRAEFSMTDMSVLAHVAAGAAAVAAGGVNAIAGGGTLITFPILTAIGVPGVRANATNTVSLAPGYLGGTYAQRRDLTGLGRGLRPRLVAAAIGGLGGSILLIVTSEAVFRQIVPFLILAACALLGFQDRLRGWLLARASTARTHRVLEVGAVSLAATYGGYFGAGLSIMLIAVLGLFSDLAFNRLNAVKQLLSFVINVCAAAFLVFSGRIEWTLVAVMAPAALIGGHFGGRLAGVIPPKRLRACVIVFGVVVALIYLVR
jgi:uncharacterized membrane protein YfcA